MESPETGGEGVDCSIGSIVWVRRRNGSWWPGKILGPDELSASHLMSPRSGTPVKLLGREDASVDWYNLEKSKRVKAFRCGEFDDCIERAEASLGMPPKKREKYARREDAILHALELERQLSEKKYGKPGCTSSKGTKSENAVRKELLTSSEYLGNGDGEPLHTKSHQVSKRPPLSWEDENGNHLLGERVKEGNQPKQDIDNSDVLPRIRGLQDIGLRTAPSKAKVPSAVASNGSQKSVLHSSSHAVPGGGLSTEKLNNADDENFPEKRKRLHDDVAEEMLSKRRDKCRPLVQVMESSARLSVPHSQAADDIPLTSVSGEEQPGVSRYANSRRYPQLTVESDDYLEKRKNLSSQNASSFLQFEENHYPLHADWSEENTSTSTEDTETDLSETDSMESDSDEDMTSLSDGAASIELQPKYLGRPEAQIEHGSISSEEFDDLALAGNISRHYDPISTGIEVSKWQLKGKRNTRGFTRRCLDRHVGKLSRGSIYNSRGNGSNDNDKDDIVENFRMQMAGYGSRVQDPVSLNVTKKGDLKWNDHPAIREYWEELGEYTGPVYIGRDHLGGRIMLLDVDVKVQSSYQREHVPMISLMSKVNDQAIVGHPLPVEVLENGSCENLLDAADDVWSETLENDAALSPMWRTARRTANFRVPRPHYSSALDNDESAKHLQFVNQDRKASVGYSTAASGGHRANMMRKSTSRPTIERTFSRKPTKKISTSPNQKIRALSSIGSQQKQGHDLKRSSNNYQVDRLIKTENTPTAVACIPVKLVFSRLHEELVGRHQ